MKAMREIDIMESCGLRRHNLRVSLMPAIEPFWAS
jgi:hypothetical protein